MECAIESEVSFEAIRQKLKERKDFDVGKAFLALAITERENERRYRDSGVIPHVQKYITYSDIARMMKTHNHFDDLEADDINLLISRFDKDVDGRIGLNEVSNICQQLI